MNITRMNLQFYMIDEDMLDELVDYGRKNGSYTQLEPVLNRDGVFKRGKDCWFEVRGQAFTYDIELFKYELSLLNAPSLSMQQINALEAIVKAKLATKKQKNMYEVIAYRVNDLQSRLSIYKGNKCCGMFN